MLAGGFPSGSVGKESAHSEGDWGLISGLGRSSREENGYLLQYSYLQSFMHRGAWQAEVHGITKSWTWLSDLHFHFGWGQGAGKGKEGDILVSSIANWKLSAGPWANKWGGRESQWGVLPLSLQPCLGCSETWSLHFKSVTLCGAWWMEVEWEEDTLGCKGRKLRYREVFV